MDNETPIEPTKPSTEPAGKMKVDPESVKDLTPSARTGNHVKGGIPKLTNSGSGGTSTGTGR
jgi:hypothetical protein